MWTVQGGVWLIPTGDNRFRESWSTALGKQWLRVCKFAHKYSLSTRTQETAYKLLTHWYATPAKLHLWFPQTPDTCWHCQGDRGTLFHIWWQCPLISPYWDAVRGVIYQMTETRLKLDAACCLLHIADVSFHRYKNSLSKHLLNAAKALIPLFWKSSRVPSIQDWLHRIADVCSMEETVAQSCDNTERFHKTWTPWFLFRSSQAFDDLKVTA